MADDLPPLVRAAYNNATMSLRGQTAAFDHAVAAILKRRPLLSGEQAREAAAAMLGLAGAVSKDVDDAA